MGCAKTHLFTCFDERIFQVQNSFTSAQARFQFLWIERLGEVVVRARVQPGHYIFLGIQTIR